MTLSQSSQLRRASGDGVTSLRHRWRGRLTPYLYLAPGFALFALFLLGPLCYSVWLSLFRWDGVTPGIWVGLSNYVKLAFDSEIIGSIGHSLILIVFYSVIPVLLALLLTAALSRGNIRGLAGFRTVLFLPQVVATVVIGVTWRWLYAQDGPINAFLHAIGLGSLARAWLGDFTWSLPALGVVGTWTMIGLCLVLLLAGVQRIPAELYEAARMDGAGAVWEFMVITLPALRREIGVALTLTIIAALRTFDLVYVTTTGGPGQATEVPALIIYRRAFREGDVGGASAIAVVLAIVILILTSTVTRIADKNVED